MEKGLCLKHDEVTLIFTDLCILNINFTFIYYCMYYLVNILLCEQIIYIISQRVIFTLQIFHEKNPLLENPAPPFN